MEPIWGAWEMRLAMEWIIFFEAYQRIDAALRLSTAQEPINSYSLTLLTVILNRTHIMLGPTMAHLRLGLRTPYPCPHYPFALGMANLAPIYNADIMNYIKNLNALRSQGPTNETRTRPRRGVFREARRELELGGRRDTGAASAASA